jgi:hypothetical protein
MNLTIRGAQEAQEANLRVIREMSGDGLLGRANRIILSESHRYLVNVTHVDTGSYRASHRVTIRGLGGVIAPDPSVRNPRTGKSVMEYAPIEERRGGSHAAYGRTFREGTVRAAGRAMRWLERELAKK